MKTELTFIWPRLLRRGRATGDVGYVFGRLFFPFRRVEGNTVTRQEVDRLFVRLGDVRLDFVGVQF